MKQQWPRVRIIPECHADTALVKFFIRGFPYIDHEAGINNVVKNFSLVKDPTYCLVGLIDDDKRKPSYLGDFIEIKSLVNVSLRKKPDFEHYVIVLKPALERFLMHQSAVVGISPSDFNLPEDIKLFCKLTKRPQIETNQDYFNLLSALKEREAPEFLALEGFLRDFIGKNV